MRYELLASQIREFPSAIDESVQNALLHDPAEAEFRILALIKSENEVAPLSPKSAALSAELTRIQALQSHFLEALEELKALSAYAQTVQGLNRSAVEARYFLEQGRIYSLQRTPIQAEACYKKAWSLAQEVKDAFLSIDIAVMFSLTQPAKMQKEWLSQALQLATESSDAKATLWLPFIHMLHGWNLFDLHRFNDALDYFNKALSGYELSQNREKTYSARWAIAKTLRLLNKPEEALELQRLIASELSVAGKTNPHVALEMAENLQLLRKFDEAKALFEEAYKEFSNDQWFKDNKAHELSRIHHLSKAK